MTSTRLLIPATLVLLVFGVLWGVQKTSAQTFDVSLAQTTPVYSRADIPYSYGRNAYDPFQAVQWIPSGHFVVSGNCNTASRTSGGPTLPLGDFEDSGMYTLTDTGAFVGTSDVCYDTSIRANACAEGGGCETGWKVLPLSGGRFVRQAGSPGVAFSRSPIVYDVSGGVSPSGLAFFNNFHFGDEPAERRIDHSAVANGALIVEEETFNGSSINRRNAIYSLPGFVKLAEFPVSYYPLIGVGGYFFANPTSDGIREPWRLYKMPTEAEARQGTRPTLIETFDDRDYLYHYALDARNPNRIAIYWEESREHRQDGSILSIYEMGPNGFTVVSEDDDPAFKPSSASLISPNGFALSGEYLAYSDCSLSRVSGLGGSHRDCDLVVEQNGRVLTVQPLPKSDSEAAVAIHSVGMSASGAILVAVTEITPVDELLPNIISNKANGLLYLYRIGGASAPPPPPTGTTTPTTGVGFSSLSDILSFASSYVEILRAVMGGGSVKPGTSFGGVTGSTTPTNAATQNALSELLRLIESN